MIASLSWKMKAKFQSGPCGHVFSSLPYKSEKSCSSETDFWKPMLMSKPVQGARCSWTCLYQLSYFLGSQTHSYLRNHGPSPFSSLFSSCNFPVRSSLKKKKICSYCCSEETKFNFWVGNWRIIHEQISSKWYDLLNFGLWFIFMYACYCYKVVPASIRSWMRSF